MCVRGMGDLEHVYHINKLPEFQGVHLSNIR
jgi:hypothetical protein